MKQIPRTLAVLYAQAFLNSLVFFAPVALFVRTRCGISIRQFFILQAVLSLSTFIFEVPCGMITDKIGYKASIILAQFLLCIARLLFLVSGYIGDGVFFLFFGEAVIESLSACFFSGTCEAYLYGIYKGDVFMKKSAAIGNFDTAGFIASTVLFVPIYHYFGVTGLILGTALAAFASLCLLPLLTGDAVRNATANGKSESISLSFFLQRLFSKRVALIFLISSILSLGTLAINFWPFAGKRG